MRYSTISEPDVRIGDLQGIANSLGGTEKIDEICTILTSLVFTVRPV